MTFKLFPDSPVRFPGQISCKYSILRCSRIRRTFTTFKLFPDSPVRIPAGFPANIQFSGDQEFDGLFYDLQAFPRFYCTDSWQDFPQIFNSQALWNSTDLFTTFKLFPDSTVRIPGQGFRKKFNSLTHQNLLKSSKFDTLVLS
jgi:hypothetical protein